MTDVIALMKPRVTALVIATTIGGMWLAPRPLPMAALLFSLIGTILLVSAANALNMYIERDIDRLMERTRNRPLPAKRLAPEVALWLGLVLAVVASAILSFGVNPMTGFLGVVAFVSYVLFYTPLKQKSTAALLVGAVPGAMPPLMGWTSVTGSIDFPGLVLFMILFLWQVPHFLAIALSHKEDFAKAGIKILPLEKGEAATKHTIIRYLAGLYAVTLYPAWFGMAGPSYLWTALILGGVFFSWGCYGLRSNSGIRWARSFFLASVVYLPILLFTLVMARNTLD